jgi:hypothetical protein
MTTTSTERSTKRREQLQAAAVRNGFANWSEMMTAIKRGTHIVCPANGKKATIRSKP